MYVAAADILRGAGLLSCLKSGAIVTRIWPLAGILAAHLIVMASTATADNNNVEGDVGLLELLRAAQLTNRALYPSGELTATVSSRWDETTTDITTAVAWKGDQTYWDYEMSQSSPNLSLHEKCRMIDDGRTLFCYWPEIIFLQKIADRSLSRAEQLSLRPDQVWFRLEGIAEWTSLLEPQKLPSGSVDDSVRIVVNRLDDDQIEIERRHSTGAVLRIVASLAANGNVVDYEGTPGGQVHIWRKGHYEWLKDSGGQSVLKSYDYERALKGDKRKPDRTFHLVVDSFKPDAQIASDRFYLSSLGVPPDATVEDVSAAGSRRYRNSRPAMLDEAALIELSRKLRAEGFAVPPRGKP